MTTPTGQIILVTSDNVTAESRVRMPQPLEYASTTNQRHMRWPWRWILAVVALLVVLGFILAADFRQVETRIDPVTGSEMRKTTYLFGLTTGPRIIHSPLESRLQKMGVARTPNWQFLDRTHYTILGRAFMWEDGTTPPIYQLHTRLAEFNAASTDAEVLEFVRTMQFGI